MLTNNKNYKRRLLDNTRVTTIADHLRAMYSGVVAEPLPVAMEKLLRQIEQRVRLQEIEA
ncbi:hypothetical protein IYX23_05270 [Methylocystis sp. L43]|nr:hypothetical protein [Methylocystis sp. L43]